MLKNGLSICFILATFILITDRSKQVNAKPVDQYTTKYDNIDIDRIVKSKRLMQSYGNCLLEKGPCTPEGRELKVYLPDALETKCSKCSEKQKKIAGIILAHLVENHKDLWDQILQKYDTDGKFRREYEGGPDEDEEEED